MCMTGPPSQVVLQQITRQVRKSFHSRSSAYELTPSRCEKFRNVQSRARSALGAACKPFVNSSLEPNVTLLRRCRCYASPQSVSSELRDARGRDAAAQRPAVLRPAARDGSDVEVPAQFRVSETIMPSRSRTTRAALRASSSSWVTRRIVLPRACSSSIRRHDLLAGAWSPGCRSARRRAGSRAR